MRRPAPVARHPRRRIGVRVVAQAAHQALDGAGKQLRIAIDEDIARRLGRLVEHEAVPAARLAALGIFDQPDPAIRITAHEIGRGIAAAVDHRRHRDPGLAKRQAVEAQRDPALLIMREHRDLGRHGEMARIMVARIYQRIASRQRRFATPASPFFGHWCVI